MAFAFVRDTQSAGSSVSSLAITVPVVGALHLVIVTVKSTSALSGLSITDNASTPNTYALATSQTNGTNNIYQYYSVATTGGATTVTTSWTGSATVRITVDEFSGNATTNATVFDKAATPTTGAGTSASTTFFPSSAGELIVAGLTCNGTSLAASIGYALANSNPSCATAYKAPGTVSESPGYNWTGSVGFTEVAAAYKPSAINPGQFFVVL